MVSQNELGFQWGGSGSYMKRSIPKGAYAIYKLFNPTFGSERPDFKGQEVYRLKMGPVSRFGYCLKMRKILKVHELAV